MTTRSIFCTLAVVALVLVAFALASLSPADVPAADTLNAVLVAVTSPSPAAPAPAPAEAGAGLALAAGAVATAMADRRKHRRTVFTLIGCSGYCVDEVRPSSGVRKDKHCAFVGEGGEEYLQRLLHLVDEDGDSDPEILFEMLWNLQYDLGIAWSKPGEDGYFKYQTRAYELTQIDNNEFILEYVVDGELVLGGSGSDEYYHAVCKIVIDGNRLTLYEYPSDPDDKYVILEVE